MTLTLTFVLDVEKFAHGQNFWNISIKENCQKVKVKVNQNVKFIKINFDLKNFCSKLKVAELETIVGGGLCSTSAVPLV